MMNVFSSYDITETLKVREPQPSSLHWMRNCCDTTGGFTFGFLGFC